MFCTLTKRETFLPAQFKGTLLQNFAFLNLRVLELYTRKVFEIFVYKHTDTIEYVKNYPTF